MSAVPRLLAAWLGLLVLTTSASAQSISASPTPFTPGATITVTAQSPTPPPLWTDLCNSACYVLATYAAVYIQGSNGFTGFNDAYDGPAAYLGYDGQPGQTMTAVDYELYTEVWVEVCLSWGWGECLSSDYWLYDDGWDVASVTPMAVPAPVGVSPSSGGGPTQTFQLQYAAASGAAHIAEGRVWIDATGAAGHTTCMVRYTTADHTLWLLNDTGTGWTSGVIGVGPLLQNSQCAVNPLAAGASASGTTWTVNVPITFAASYAGAKNVWLDTAGPAGQSAWQLLGTWTARARVDSAWPSPGVVGGTLTVQGLGFGASQGTSTLTVNGVTAAVSSWSDTTIAATVPPGATTGPIVVTTAGQASNGLSYTIVDGPQLSHLSPSWGPVATTVTLHGTNFGTTAGTVQWHQDRDATSGWQPVAHVSGTWADTSVQVVIPAGLVTGFFKVERAGALSNGSPFTVGTEEVQYHHADGIGSLRLVTGVQGHVVSRHEYQPFGEEWLAAGAHDADRLGFGGKELDQETGSGGWAALNYFGARYLHSPSGRFVTPDPALDVEASLSDPQRWNRYRYAKNNPVRYVDPDGRYERDVHQHLTALLARAAGYGGVMARQIGRATQAIDDDEWTNPMNITAWGVMSGTLKFTLETYHFTTEATRREHWRGFQEHGRIRQLGAYLHAMQDSFSHDGFGPHVGHITSMHTPDYTWMQPDKANVMAYDTFDALIMAKGRLGVRGKSLTFDQIFPYVDKFNNARNEKDKAAALEEFDNFLRDYGR